MTAYFRRSVLSSAVVESGSKCREPSVGAASCAPSGFLAGLCLVDMVLVHLVYEGVRMGRFSARCWGNTLRFAAGGFIFLAGLGISYIFLPKAHERRTGDGGRTSRSGGGRFTCCSCITRRR